MTSSEQEMKVFRTTGMINMEDEIDDSSYNRSDDGSECKKSRSNSSDEQDLKLIKDDHEKNAMIVDEQTKFISREQTPL